MPASSSSADTSISDGLGLPRFTLIASVARMILPYVFCAREGHRRASDQKPSQGNAIAGDAQRALAVFGGGIPEALPWAIARGAAEGNG